MFSRDHGRGFIAPSSFVLGHLDIGAYVCVKILIMQSSDKACTCNWDCNKFRILSGQIKYIYNFPLPYFFTSCYLMGYWSQEGCNLFHPLGLVDCWYHGAGRIARINSLSCTWDSLSTSPKFYDAKPNSSDCKHGHVLFIFHSSSIVPSCFVCFECAENWDTISRVHPAVTLQAWNLGRFS